jgi:hypothetical protein
LVQLYGEYTRRGTLVCDPVESGAVSRLLDDVIFTSYKFFELREMRGNAIMWNATILID